MTNEQALTWAIRQLHALVHVSGDGAAYIRGTGTELAGFAQKIHEAEQAVSQPGEPGKAQCPQGSAQQWRLSGEYYTPEAENYFWTDERVEKFASQFFRPSAPSPETATGSELRNTQRSAEGVASQGVTPTNAGCTALNWGLSNLPLEQMRAHSVTIAGFPAESAVVSASPHYYCVNENCSWIGHSKPHERICPKCGSKVWKEGSSTLTHKLRPDCLLCHANRLAAEERKQICECGESLHEHGPNDSCPKRDGKFAAAQPVAG